MSVRQIVLYTMLNECINQARLSIIMDLRASVALASLVDDEGKCDGLIQEEWNPKNRREVTPRDSIEVRISCHAKGLIIAKK